MGDTGKVIAIGNLKGGVGKSTLAVNLGCALAVRGLGTLVLDTDPQQTSTAWTRGRRLPCEIRPYPIRDLGAVGGWLDELASARRQHARIVIDLPAVLSPALAAAFLAADVILIPTSFSPIDLEATRRTVRHARLAAEERAARPPLILAVPIAVRRGWLGKPVASAPRHRLPGIPLAPSIGYDPAFAEAFEQSDWIGGVAPRSRAHREVLAVADLVEIGLAGGPVTGGQAPGVEDRTDPPPARRRPLVAAGLL